MATPQWLASSMNGNAEPGGSPDGSVLTKVAGAHSVFNAPARTRDILNGVGSFEFQASITDEIIAGLTTETLADAIIGDNLPPGEAFPYHVTIGSGFASVRHNGVYFGDLTGVALTGIHAFKVECFDSGGGLLKIRYLLDGVVKVTESIAAVLPQAFGINIATLNATVTNIAAVGASIDNLAPVVDAGANQTVLESESAELLGSATDDGLPSGTLTYAWTKVSGPGSVTFDDAASASTSAAFGTLGVYVLRLSVSDGALTGTDDVTITYTAQAVKPVAPLTYDLDASDTVRRPPTPLPVLGAAGSVLIDPSYDTPIRAITDILTNAGESFGTPSGTASNGWAPDDKAFIAVGEGGTYIIFDFDPITGIPTRAESFIAGTEPTFSRDINKPHILYACRTSNELIITRRNRLTNAWEDVYDLTTDVPALVPFDNSYMSAVYNSEDDPERIAVIYGRVQDTHQYMTILDADDPDARVTLDVELAKIKINGGSWQQLVRHDGTNSTVNIGLHSLQGDRTGTWWKLSYAATSGGAKKGAFFNMNTLRIHEVDHNKWFGHAVMGRGTYVTAAAGTAPAQQWEFTDLAQGGVFPTGRMLMSPADVPGDWFQDDHTSWGGCRVDGQLTPIVFGTQRTQGPALGGPAQYANEDNWNVLWETIGAIATATGRSRGSNLFWVACHHRNAYVNALNQYIATFRDCPRVQTSHGGLWTLFTSNWGLTRGTKGTEVNSAGYLINHRRDLLLVRMSRTSLVPPLPSEEGEDDQAPLEIVLDLASPSMAPAIEVALPRLDTQDHFLEVGKTMADVEIYRGARKTINFTLSGSGDITDYTIRATVKEQDSAGKARGPAVMELVGTVTSGAARKFSITVTESDSNKPPTDYVWDIWRADGVKYPLMPLSRFRILSSVTYP